MQSHKRLRRRRSPFNASCACVTQTTRNGEATSSGDRRPGRVQSDPTGATRGKLRLRGSGTAGGQKGLQNIIDLLGTTQVARLRVGIGRPQPPIDPTDYVLGRFSAEEKPAIDAACALAADAVEVWVQQGLAAAMNKYNIGGSVEG